MPETNRPDNSRPRKKDITDNSADFEFEALPVTITAEPVVDYARRIKMLMAGIIIAIMAYTAAWFWVGSQIVKATEAAMAGVALKGQVISCGQPTAIGYPFRIGLNCAKTGFADQSQNLKIEAGAFRSAAQIYRPSHLIGELDGPLIVSTNQTDPFTVTWALAHTSFSGNGGLPARISVEIKNPIIAETDAPRVQIGSAILAALHMRQGENNQIDLASNIDAAKIKDAPVFNFSFDASVSGATRFDAAIKSGKPLIEVLRGNQGELRNINMAFLDGGSVTISGPFSLSVAGLLSGTFSLKAEKAGDFIDNLGKLSTSFGPAQPNLDTLKAMAVDNQFNLTITIKDGNASLGFIPLGKIPAL